MFRTHTSLLICLFLLGACGGGGGGGSSTPPPAPTVNSPPVAVNDTVSLVEDTPTTINVTSNDTDSDGSLSSITITTNTTNGQTQISGTSVTYTPNADFTGSDSFSYTVTDNDGAASGAATVTITVTSISTTSITVIDLTIPASDYNILNNAELNADVLTSTNQTFDLPPNAVSFEMALLGPDADDEGSNLFITGLVDAGSNSLAPLTKRVTFCEKGLCSALVPKKPGINLPSGQWQYSLGTRSANLNNIDLPGLSLRAAIRTGPTPDLAANFPATLKIKPFLTASSIDNALLTRVLDDLKVIATANKINLTIAPITVVADGRFDEVSKFFTNAETAELVTLGDADAVNLFFLEDFSGIGSAGTLGITGGVPATMGIKSSHNGVLIDASAMLTNPRNDNFYAQATAKVAFHEMGHFLGLFHTTEADFSNQDILDDTPLCQTTPHDQGGNNNGIADITECPDGNNIMFWNIDFAATQDPLTGDQRQVIVYAPIATP